MLGGEELQPDCVWHKSMSIDKNSSWSHDDLVYEWGLLLCPVTLMWLCWQILAMILSELVHGVTVRVDSWIAKICQQSHMSVTGHNNRLIHKQGHHVTKDEFCQIDIDCVTHNLVAIPLLPGIYLSIHW